MPAMSEPEPEPAPKAREKKKETNVIDISAAEIVTPIGQAADGLAKSLNGKGNVVCVGQ